jgi:hypothetical protein
MNCSQLLEKRVTTNWEKPAQTLHDSAEKPEPPASDSYRWVTVRYSSVGQTMAYRILPTFKPLTH